MRVTQSMLSNNFLRNLSRSYEKLGFYQEQLTTGKKITRPSDDPVIAIRGLSNRTELTEIQQFKRNINTVRNWMDNSDSALNEATQAMQKLRELAVQASNDSYEESQRENIASEVRQLKQHLIDIANSKAGDQYIFNGNNTKVAPVTENADGTVNVSGNSNAVNIEVSSGVNIRVNINPANVFTGDLFQDIEGFADDLEAGLSGEDLNQYIGELDSHIGNLVDERADLGARQNRVELIENRLESQEVLTSRILSDNEDVEVEKVIMNLKTQEAVHRAALSAGARIMQPTLMDFLR